MTVRNVLVGAVEQHARRERLKGSLIVAAATLAAIAVAIFAATTLSGENTATVAKEVKRDIQRDSLVGSCDRGNKSRGYEIRAAMENPDRTEARVARALLLFPILHCPETVRTGRPVPLSPARQLAYVEREIPKLPPIPTDGQ